MSPLAFTKLADSLSFVMSTVEMAIEKVRHLDDAHARQLLAWQETQEHMEARRPAALTGLAGAWKPNTLNQFPTTLKTPAQPRTRERKR